MTPQERADLNEIAYKLVLQINEITPVQWDKHDDKDRAIVLAALQATRRAALLEACVAVSQFSSDGRPIDAQELRIALVQLLGEMAK